MAAWPAGSPLYDDGASNASAISTAFPTAARTSGCISPPTVTAVGGFHADDGYLFRHGQAQVCSRGQDIEEPHEVRRDARSRLAAKAPAPRISKSDRKTWIVPGTPAQVARVSTTTRRFTPNTWSSRWNPEAEEHATSARSIRFARRRGRAWPGPPPAGAPPRAPPVCRKRRPPEARCRAPAGGRRTHSLCTLPSASRLNVATRPPSRLRTRTARGVLPGSAWVAHPRHGS